MAICRVTLILVVMDGYCYLKKLFAIMGLRGTKSRSVFIYFVVCVLTMVVVPISLVAQNNIYNTPSGKKIGGICFRIDDDHSISQWYDFAKVFDKYGYHFTFALNLAVEDQVDEYFQMIRSLQASGHEMADHTPNHTTLFFTVTDTVPYSGLPGVDHVSSNTIFLKYNSLIDTSLYFGQAAPGGCVIDIIGGKAYSKAPGAFKDFVKQSGYLLGIYIPGTNQLFSIRNVTNVWAADSSDIDTLRLLSPWGENIPIRDTAGVWCHFIGLYNVDITNEALGLLVQRTLQLCEEHGIQRPYTWIEPGGLFWYPNTAQVKQVMGDQYGYTAAASDPYVALKCFNEYDPNADKRFGMEWGNFYDDIRDLQVNESLIADKVAKHYFLIGHSHFSALLGGWSGYLGRVDSLLAWCKKNADRINVVTYSEMAHVLYDVPQNSYINIIPPLNVDLDNNNMPDGYFQGSGYTDGMLDTTDGVPEGGYYSYAIRKIGSICYISGLAGLEKGENDFSIWTKGAPGDTITVTFSFSGYPDQIYKFPAADSIWTQYVIQQSANGNHSLIIPVNVSTLNFRVSCTSYASGIVRISGMDLHKKLDVALKIVSVPDTIIGTGTSVSYQVETVSSVSSGVIHYSFLEAPNWLSLNQGGLVQGVAPNDTGSAVVAIAVKDQNDSTDVQTYTIHVVKETHPQLQIVSTPDTVVAPNAAYYYSLYAIGSHPADTLSYSILNGPKWLTMSADGILSGTAPLNDSAAGIISVLVKDQHADVDTQSFSLAIHPLIVDDFSYSDSPLNHGWFANLGSGEVSVGFDSTLQMRTLKLATSSGLDYGVDKYGRWLANTVSASIKPNSDYMFSVWIVDSKSTSLYLKYYPGKGLPSVNPDNTISFYLGSLPHNGGWQTLARDLNNDLRSVKWSATVRRILGISIRGSVEISGLTVGEHVAEVSNALKPVLPVSNFALDQNYPNPFNPSTVIGYDVPQSSRITMLIFNVLGQKVKTLVKNTVVGEGHYSVQWLGENDFNRSVSSGVYYCRIEAEPLNGSKRYSAVRKMILLR